MDYVAQVRPHQCTFVPDETGAFTSDHGWNLPADAQRLAPMIEQRAAARRAGQPVHGPGAGGHAPAPANWVPTASSFTPSHMRSASAPPQQAEVAAALRGGGGGGARRAGSASTPATTSTARISRRSSSAVPGVDEVSIGHALIADALEFGLGATVRMYLAEIRKAGAMRRGG